MFSALVMSLPTGRSTVRMRVWRALKATGCGVLRDGVYLLPEVVPQAAALAEAQAEVTAAGGFAMTVAVKPKSPDQLEELRRLFDRGPEYGDLVARIAAAKAALGRIGRRKAATLVQRLRSAFEALAEIDYFPGEAQLQARNALSALEGDAGGLAAGEPRSRKGRPRRLDRARYRDRVWATRSDLWVDRLACAWLVRRFIDRNARFAWIERPRDLPRGAVGFDFDGAEFSHVGGRVTFEVLLASFGLEHDPALVAIGQAVHYLDAGGIPVADARGMETLLKGIKAKTSDDDRTFAEAAKIFDLLYAAYDRKHTDGHG